MSRNPAHEGNAAVNRLRTCVPVPALTWDKRSGTVSGQRFSPRFLLRIAGSIHYGEPWNTALFFDS